MNQQTLFTLALGLTPPWRVVDLKFSLEEKRIDIFIDFPKGSLFTCPTCGGTEAKAFDTDESTWRHLNFFQYTAHLHARVPRVECPKGCPKRQVHVPWSRQDSHFTLLFDALVMILAQQMPVNAIARLLGEHDTRLWRILHYYVDEAREQVDHSSVTQVGVDETSAKRGHDYITLFVDIKESKLLFATEGKDKATVAAFSQDLVEHGGDPSKIEEVCSDLSPAFIAGLEKEFPKAFLTVDKFHIVKLMNDAVDRIRKEEAAETDLLKNTKHLWLKNPPNLTKRERAKLESLPCHRLKTARGYQIRLTFQEFYDQPDEKAGERFLKRWYFWATHSRLQPIVEVAQTIKKHWQGILRWFSSKLTTSILEGINSLIQAAKARARGYRNKRNLIAIAYLLAGKLNFNLPLPT